MGSIKVGAGTAWREAGRPEQPPRSMRLFCVADITGAGGRTAASAHLSQPAGLAKMAGRTDIAVTDLPKEIVGSYDDRAVVKGGGKL
ncbi:UNVERIFIED_ORG: hypothetical protein GGE44_000697 [Rhizobium esperanzae]